MLRCPVDTARRHAAQRKLSHCVTYPGRFAIARREEPTRGRVATLELDLVSSTSIGSLVDKERLHQITNEIWIGNFDSRFMQNPTKHHLEAAKRILRYVAGTVDYEIYYTKVSKFDLCQFTDSDWASSVDDQKSTSANVFNIGSGAIL
ncbi:hypothetical protein ZIOFF_059917 [Zingiber officinale]|uniref:Mitochondrial protein n=1 Tax=Zingiber officinale TaxID=94328 RepID=A0A8J5FFX7_ZINOF|nr:hypothetical protein ZIOFF_059917 [Zingiber officinale]